MTPEQQEIYALLGKIWAQMPALRFLQLIGNCFGPVSGEDIYFVEDAELLQVLRDCYKYPVWRNGTN